MTAIEMIDVVDDGGMPTGLSKSRDAVHRDGDLHKTVHVWIVNSRNEILFQQRSLTKESFPGLWDVSAAGHIESGETSIDAAVKELREELGIGVASADLRFLFSVKNSSVQNNGAFVDNEISDVYLARLDCDISGIRFQESEVSGVRFLGFAGLARLSQFPDAAFTPHGREYRLLHEYLLADKK